MRSFSIYGRRKASLPRSSSSRLHGYPGAFLGLEERLTGCGLRLIAGVDEAGRGPLAGPVVASAVILNPDRVPLGMDDSKRLSVRERVRLCEEIKQTAVSVGIGVVSAVAIDTVNILEATRWAMTQAVLSLDVQCDCVVVDGAALPDVAVPVVGMVKGDARCVSIAAASIVAKVTRDRLMERMHVLYPRYSFLDNKGYGTRRHLEALRRYGPTRIHRLSFEPVLNALAGRM